MGVGVMADVGVGDLPKSDGELCSVEASPLLRKNLQADRGR